MSKRGKKEPLSGSIELALDFGQFVSYGRMWEFVSGLERVKEQVDALVDQGEAERAIKLYELFLAGVHEKAEEADDSGGCLGVFFESLFVSWIAARQKAGRPAEETVREILGWMDNDDYGFCHAMHGEMARTLDKAGLALFRGHFQNLFETAFTPLECETPRRIQDYPAEVCRTARVLKTIYSAKGDVRSYIALCERMDISPEDCEKIGEMCRGRRRIAEALEWVERGLSLVQGRQWGKESGYSLEKMRRELLAKAGRTDEAFQMAWEQFQSSPCEYAYADLMKYVPKKDRERWHKRALDAAGRKSLSGLIGICVRTREWEILARRVDAVTRETLEGEGHYVMERAAKGLARDHALAAAKVYAALGMRIVKAGKSKYYQYALGHLRDAKRLAEKAGHPPMWLSLVEEVRMNHARKQSFMPDFEEIAAGRKPAPSSFEDRARKRWKKQVSK